MPSKEVAFKMNGPEKLSALVLKILKMFTTLFFLFVLKQCNSFLIFGNRSLEIGPMELNHPSINSGNQPDYYDWREQNQVSPVKNQLNCKACWAFATVANIESHLSIYRKIKEVLSEQFLIDCDDEQNGCENGSILKSFATIVSKFGGVLRDTDYYPYEERQDKCRWHKPPPQPVPVVGFRRVPPNEKMMAEYIWKYGPVSAAINSASMGTYKPNTIDEPSNDECDPDKRDHAVLIVGYNAYKSDDGKVTPYWIIKNSWGADWGDHGYYYLVRGRNACGIATDVSFAIVS